MINIDEVGKVVHTYLDRNPRERRRLTPLLDSLAAGTAVTSRSTFTGHVTCSAIIIDPGRTVLHIGHNSLGLLLRPGGHLEPHDLSLIDAARREVLEETGIPTALLTADSDLPIDIDVHTIPANPRKREPEHPHFDLRFVFTVTARPDVTLQAEEVHQFRWVPVAEIEPAPVRRKLT